MLTATAPSTALGPRADVRRFAAEQSALRRVVRLVARGSSLEIVFAAVAKELGRLVGIAGMTMVRYEPDGTVGVVGRCGGWQAEGEQDIASLVRRTERSARIRDDTVGAPIVVDERVWGALLAASRASEALPLDTEPRLEVFTELGAGTLIHN